MFKNLEKTSIDKTHQKDTAGTNKVIAMSSSSVAALDGRPMTKDDRRIIMMELDDLHDGKKYILDWSDEKVAKKLGVPRNWVSSVREVFLGPDINEQSMQVINAENLLTEINAEHAAMIKRTDELMARAIELKAAIANLKH